MINSNLESVILAQLFISDNFAQKILPFVNEEHFDSIPHKQIYKHYQLYFDEYNTRPTKEAILIFIDRLGKVNNDNIEKIKEVIQSFQTITLQQENFILDETEYWYKERTLYNALRTAVNTFAEEKQKIGTIPELLQNAVSACFDSRVGHEYIEDYEERYKLLHDKVEKIPFDLDLFNKITRGGIERKTLNVVLAGTGVGKTMFLCHLAASSLLLGHNILYITLEMSKEKISTRVDANLLNVTLDSLESMPYPVYEKLAENLKNKTHGRLFIQEYPTAMASVLHFRHLLNDLKIKKNFTPDVLIIDYLNIANSSRKTDTSNSYQHVKYIAEELRGLAVEHNVPIWTATQVNRQGFKSSDVGLEDTSESFGVPATADFMFALLRSDELDQLNQITIKQLKNRYSDLAFHKKFVIGVDRTKMKFFDVEQHSDQLSDSGKKSEKADIPLYDKSLFKKKDLRKDFTKIDFTDSYDNDEDDLI